MLSWNEYCEIHHISKKDKKEIENLIQWRKNYLSYLKKIKKVLDKSYKKCYNNNVKKTN